MASLSLSLSKNPNPIITNFPKHNLILNNYKTKPPNLIITCSLPSSSIKNKTLQKTTTHNNNDNNYHDEYFPLNQPESHVDEEDQEIREQPPPPLSEIWRQIQGANDWEGHVDPLSHHLRREILRYGDFAQACYDSFDFDPHSKYCGTCKYTGAHFFEKLGMSSAGYRITRYLYATSDINLPNFFRKSTASSAVWSPHANWMGYVAVSDDPAEVSRLGRRDILIAWRGTVTYLEWICDLKDILRPAGFGPDPTVKVESGFFDLYTKKESECKYCSFSAREQVLAEVKRLVDYYSGDEISITVTGHSLGSALAILSAYDIAEVGLNLVDHGNDENLKRNIPVTVYSFAGPRVGNLKFKERCDGLGVKVLRIVNVNDVVPSVPGILANEKVKFQKYLEETMSFPWSYAHVGVEIGVDHSQSPFLKPSKDPGSAHNLEVHLHLVDGFRGKGERFCLDTKRDIALVNKNCDLLKPEYGVPPNWRQDENKGMVRDQDGRWVVPERQRLEGHPPDTAHHLQKIVTLLKNNHNNNNTTLKPA